MHEIGHHSYSHTYPDKFPSGEAEAEDYAKARPPPAQCQGYPAVW